jgi:hypothetical protein
MFFSIKPFIKFFTIFFLLFDINFKFIPGFTTARCTFFALFIYSVLKLFKKNTIGSKSFYKSNAIFIFTLFMIYLVAIIQYFFSDDITQLGRLTYFSLYGLITPFLLSKYFNSRKEFLLLVGIAAVVQSILTLASYFNPAVSNLFNNLILYNANFGQENKLRALGFATVAGATLSVIEFAGIASLLIYMRNYPINFIKSFAIWLSIIIILVAILFIGRTGLFLSLVAIIIYFLSFGLDIKKFLFLILIFIIFTQINFISILDKFTNDVDGYNTELFVGWLNSGFRLNNDLVQGLSQMPIPELTLKTFFGTGLVKDPSSGGNASGHDTGYIQTYYSLGLIFAIIFYCTYFLFLFKQVKKYKDYLGFLLILVLIVIESKEFFIFSYTFPLFLLSFILISQNEKIDNTTTTLFHEKVRIKNY